MFPKRCLILLACWTLLQSAVAVPDVALEQPGPEDDRLEERDFGLQERGSRHPALESSLLSVLTEKLASTTPGGGDGGTTAPGGGGGTTTVPGGGGGTTTVPGGGGGTTVPGGGGE
jgi:hypothetical protein